MTDILNDLIKNVSENIPGYIALSVTEIESGETLVSDSVKADFDIDLASAYNLEVVNAKLKAISVLGLNEEVKDITITLTDQIHIINIAPNGGYFIYLAIDSAKANIAITKTLLNKYKADLNNAI
ncbi:hypothetical protein J2Q11_01165 [Tenacibaculum finnmarkense genomovar finnmarkense]|uniref:Roadblock/LAMTOR2 domain-containing protein n=1 Tax=Tenacibaculum finnmarkense genomovar finnmarkense TaxID=1458503 RepID=A0AAP1WF54_9FLAO|nr:hypothetical protein [Tenacibaculum finnmarkense]MCD8404141.1 hypothetical protein [Tenacibaculum dicentrarchi]MBE7651696.1 hypothetical protein [Tenacibaculum finnmarkense genomovar finnmarkense]MBE7659500.1 hypothetical protein [Tenacibaculum finnmarkense genomovar finnmarkense]MBE7693954.1 hypothetical protein [Tenacibaculum finnmarkense genomovar finnmarkense]MCD8407068.1 hypothetical protein [Tenacibaculum dicentrarchi]